jgi:hypothetical protein
MPLNIRFNPGIGSPRLHHDRHERPGWPRRPIDPFDAGRANHVWRNHQMEPIDELLLEQGTV